MIAAVFYRPPLGWPIALVAVCAVALAALVLALRHDRRVLIATLRLFALAAMGWILLGPSVLQPGNDAAGQDLELVLLVDRSGSMAEADVALGAGSPEVSRMEALQATWLSSKTLAELERYAHVRAEAFDDQFYPYPPEHFDAAKPDGQATRLHEAVARVDAPVTVVLSDGHDTTTDAGQPIERTRPSTDVVFAVPVGASRGAPDASVRAWALSDRLTVGQATEVHAQVYQRGFDGRQARIDLLLEGQRIDSRSIRLDETTQDVTFQVTPELGAREPSRVHGYACRVTVLDEDEAYTDNNTEHVFIQVVREKTRVLLLEGDPYWDTRSLARLIGAHPDFELTAIFALGDRRQVVTRGEDSPYTGELTPEVLRRFDVVVLGREVQRVMDLETAAALEPFVKDMGGAVIFARGQPFGDGDVAGVGGQRAIERISPVRFGQRESAGLRLAVSDAARGNPLTDLGGDAVINRLPGMIAATRVAGRQSASVVLLEQADSDAPSAAVSTLRAGRGVTMAVLADGLWRWELLPQELDDLDSVYAVFWTRALQWLASGGVFLPGQDVSLTLDRLTADPGGTINLQASPRYTDARGFEPTITVTAPDGSISTLEALQPGTTGGVSTRLAYETTGVYRVELTTPGRPDLVDPAHPLAVRFAVIDRSPELRDTSARPAVLEAIAARHGGACLALDETQPLIDHLKERRAARLVDDTSVYRFARLPVFALIFGAFGLEWLLRRKDGLL